MSRVQAYHLLGKKTSIENAIWKEQSGGKEYKYTGTIIFDGVVYDHIRYRARGGTWRYALGKNMWKFDFGPSGKALDAKDDFGRSYAHAWKKLNLRSLIDQGQYGRRGEQGMCETLGFRLFTLAGVPAPNTFWLQLRIIDEADEGPPDQYQGDFWGLYLAIENEDGRFLKSHGLPDGNLFKMAGGGGELSHQGPDQPKDKSDLNKFMADYGGNQTDEWWQKNLDLPTYYSYRAVLECIHHYDIGEGKNYDYYRNPRTGQWTVIPWDIDLTWADHMYGNGEEPFKSRVLTRPAFQVEYQNRLREIRNLLFNAEQVGAMIDEYAPMIGEPLGGPSPAEADRRKWDFHPAMAIGGNAGQGLFYQAAANKSFPGMVQLMRDYVISRGTWVDSTLLNDPAIPATPTATYVAAMSYRADALRFKASPYKGQNPFAAARWRIAEITPDNAHRTNQRIPRLYEITPTWEGEEIRNPAAEVTIPASAVKPGRTYRVRVRMKDTTGRWSHWSAPVPVCRHLKMTGRLSTRSWARTRMRFIEPPPNRGVGGFGHA